PPKRRLPTQRPRLTRSESPVSAAFSTLTPRRALAGRFYALSGCKIRSKVRSARMSLAAERTSAILTPQLLAQLERLELVSRKVFRGRMKGERKSKRKGQSVEFADFRQYVPGDDLRFIEWNLFARLERLYRQ